MKVLNLEGATTKIAGACAAGFHETPWQPMSWVQIGLQEPHCARPSWLVLRSHLGGRQCPTEGRQKSRSKWAWRAGTGDRWAWKA